MIWVMLVHEYLESVGMSSSCFFFEAVCMWDGGARPFSSWVGAADLRRATESRPTFV